MVLVPQSLHLPIQKRQKWLKAVGNSLELCGVEGHALQTRCGMPVEARTDKARAASVLKSRTEAQKISLFEPEERIVVD